MPCIRPLFEKKKEKRNNNTKILLLLNKIEINDAIEMSAVRKTEKQ